MRRWWRMDGQLPVIPSTTIQRLSLRADPAPSDKVEIPKDLDPKVIAHLEAQGAEKFKGTLPKVPEKYNVKFPDKAALPKDVLERTTAKARELGLTKDEHAQQLLDFVLGEAQSIEDGAVKTHGDRLKQWEQEALDAADIGKGNPAHLSAVSARVGRLLQKFFPEKARALITEYGIGSNPDFIRGLSKIADLAKEDMIEGGDPGKGRTGTPASRIYNKDRQHKREGQK